jgi:hypothetical protein
VNDLLGIISAWDGYPSVAANQRGGVFVTWESDRNDPTHADFDIYFASAQSGIGEMAQRKLSSDVISIYPTIFSNILFIKPMDLGFNRNKYGMHLYDVTGRLIKSFDNKVYPIVWDGRDESGARISPGIYYMLLSLDKKVVQTQKIVKIK